MFSIISGTFFAFSSLLARKVLKGKKDAWAYSFWFSLIGTIISFFAILFDYRGSSNLPLWALLFFIGILIVVHNLLNFTASHYLEASIKGSITKFRLIWTFLIGVIFLHDELTLLKLAGTIFTVLAGLLVVFKYKKLKLSRGILFAFVATIIFSTVIALYKVVLQEFNPATLTFFVFLIPTVINFIIMPNSTTRIRKFFLEEWRLLIPAATLAAFANLSMNFALAQGEISRVSVIIEAFLVVTLIGEHFILKEKKNWLIKLIAVILAVIGAVLIKA